MATANLFTTAKIVPAKVTKAKQTRLEVDIAGLATYAQIVAAEKAIQALKETYRVQVEAEIVDHFVTEGRQIKRRPENFRGVDQGTSASCELRKRSSASKLNDSEIELLTRFGIAVETVTDQPEAFIFNPVYKDDQKMLEKISKALSKIEGLPADLIQLQPVVEKKVVTETSLDQVFALKDESANNQITRTLLAIVGTLAVKPKVDDFEAVEAFKALATLVGAEEEEA